MSLLPGFYIYPLWKRWQLLESSQQGDRFSAIKLELKQAIKRPSYYVSPEMLCCLSWYLNIWFTLFQHDLNKDGGKQWQPEFSLSNGDTCCGSDFNLCVTAKNNEYFRNIGRELVLLAPQQGGTKHGWRCSHSTWSWDDLWAAFPWVWPAGKYLDKRGTFWTHGRTNVAEISRSGGMALHSGFYEYHSCTLCREVPHLGLYPKVPSLPLAPEITFFQSIFKIHDHR